MTLPVLPPVFGRRAAGAPGAAVASSQEGLRPLGRVPGQEHPGQGDVLELAQVAEVVVDGQAVAPAPSRALRPARPARPAPVPASPGPAARSGKKSPAYSALRLVEQVERAVQIAFGLADPGHRDPPAVRVLRQPGVLAQLLAAQQVLRGGSAGRRARGRSSLIPTYMSAVPRSTGAAAARRRTLQAPARRCASPRRDDPARCRMSASVIAQPRTSEMCPARSQARHRTRRTPVRGLEIPARPGREPQQRRLPQPRPRWSSSATRSSARRACVTVPATSPRTRARAARYSSIAAGRRRNSSSSTTTIAAAGAWRSVTGIRRRVQPPLGVPQACLDALELAARQQRPDEPDAEHRPDPDHLVGQRLEPADAPSASCRLLAHGRDRQLDQVRRPLEVLGGQRVADRLGRLAVLLVPRARPPVQVGERRRAARPAGAPAARRRRGGGSGTTGGGRRAGPGTGCRAPAPPAWPCRRPGR